MNKGLVITIDGPSGAGKTSAARSLAKRIGYLYLDTGALYRSVGWKVIKDGINPDNEKEINDLCSSLDINIKRDGDNNMIIFSDNVNITQEIRKPEVSKITSLVSAFKVVRDKLLPIQRRIGEEGGVVIEGRDTGTVIFPDANVKFYLDASIGERGKRRWEELQKAGVDVNLSATIEDIRIRDKNDSERAFAPLRKAEDAILIDTTNTKPDEVIERMLLKLTPLL